MKGLDGEFECDTQETRGLWIESLPIKILSDRHRRKPKRLVSLNMARKGTLVGVVSDPNKSNFS
jgi:hypothetical protein